MQERAYERRGEQYLLIKSPPASGKSRLAEPRSEEAARICQEDLNEVVSAFVQDKAAIERSDSCEAQYDLSHGLLELCTEGWFVLDATIPICVAVEDLSAKSESFTPR